MTPIPLIQYRDNLHREIIIYTMKLNQFNEEFDLLLKEPFVYDRSYYRPYSSERGPEMIKILGVDGTSGELLSENQFGESRFIYYHELTLEELTRLHHSVLQGEYVLQILN
jgi:hypothetical protein